MSDPDEAELRIEHAATFKDADVAAAYRYRLPYPAGLFPRLASYLPAGCERVVDLGCGTGDLSRPLAQYVAEIDAVDFSPEMLEVAKGLLGGDSQRIRWHQAPVEEFAYVPPYGLATAGESLHWFDLSVLVPRLAAVLCPGGMLAVVFADSRGSLGRLLYEGRSQLLGFHVSHFGGYRARPG
jgi:2-polyprenyl-3-methyl-5-hydroxy-6-metoxy-1,4-benzoquinol methylase